MSAEEIPPSVRAGKAIVNADNPWPGLLAFRETDEHYFQGRRSETEDLFRIVMRERLVVLFGLSGLGKSSLLQAGLFPLLRPRSLLPVYIRLDLSGSGLDLVEQVKSVVTREASVHGIEAPQPRAGETLWEYFHREGNTFWNRRNRPEIPLLVFDQFEEVFTLGRLDPDRANATEAFIDQLADIAEGRPPAALKAWIDEHPDEARAFDFNRHHYKVLLSIREDFLPDLESLRARMPALALNRLRLRRMNGEAALNVVSQAEHLIDSEVALEVVRFVAADERGLPLADLEVEPALLSVVCRELNNRRLSLGEARITAGLLEGSQDQVLTDFYERSTADLPQEVRLFIEDRLLTVSGYRDSVALENALSVPGMSRHSIDELVERRLVRREDRGGVQRLELTHDLLAGVVRERREARRLREEADKERAALLRNQQEQQQALLRAQEEQRLEIERTQEREKRERERREFRRFRIAAGVFLLLGLLAVAAMVMAQRSQRRAEDLRISAQRDAEAARKARAQAEAQSLVIQQQQKLLEQEKVAADLARQQATVSAVVSSSREVATAALLNLGADPELSLLLALAASDRFETPEASDVLHRALEASRIRFSLPITTQKDDPVSVRAKNADRTEIWLNDTGSFVSIFQPGGKLTTWDMAGSSPKRSERTVPGRPYAAAFTQDGKMLAIDGTSGDGEGFSLWSVAEGRVVAELKAEKSNHLLQKLAFSPDGRFLAVTRCGTPFRVGAGCRDPLLDLWDIAAKRRVGQNLPAIDDGEVGALVWSSDSCLAAGGSKITEAKRGLIAVWRNASANTTERTLFTDEQSGEVNGIAFTGNPGCELVYSAQDSHSVGLLHPTSARNMSAFGGHTAGLRAIARSADGTLLATGSADHTARIWDLRTNQERFALRGHKDEVRKVVFSSDGKRLATLSMDDTVKVWNLAPNGELRSWSEPSGSQVHALSGDGSIIVTGRPGGTYVVDLVSGIAHRSSDPTIHAAVSADGRLLARITANIIEIEDRIERRTLPSFRVESDFVFRLHFAGVAGRLLVDCEREPRVRDVLPPHDIRLPARASKSYLFGAISPDGQLIALRDDQFEMAVWNLGTGRGASMLSPASDSADPVFSPDNKLIAGSGPDGNIVIWDAGSGTVVRNFSGHSGSVTALAFSSDGKLLASGGADKVTRIWDRATGEQQLSLFGHTEPIKHIAFSPNLQRLTTVTSSGQALVYALDFQSLVALARTRVTRTLARDECRKFLHDDHCSASPLETAPTAPKRGQ